jgi:hypothetical protein
VFLDFLELGVVGLGFMSAKLNPDSGGTEFTSSFVGDPVDAARVLWSWLSNRTLLSRASPTSFEFIFCGVKAAVSSTLLYFNIALRGDVCFVGAGIPLSILFLSSFSLIRAASQPFLTARARISFINSSTS